MDDWTCTKPGLVNLGGNSQKIGNAMAKSAAQLVKDLIQVVVGGIFRLFRLENPGQRFVTVGAASQRKA